MWQKKKQKKIYGVLYLGIWQGRCRLGCHENKNKDPGDNKVYHGRETGPSYHQSPGPLQETVPRIGGRVLWTSW